MSSSAKRQVIQRLHDMGFSDSDIRAAITECGYNVEACADWIVNRKQTDKKPRLFVGMEVWIFSPDDNDWAPGNVVSITKQLLSIIFNGHDFRWLEKESDLYRIQDDKPAPLHNTNTYGNNNRHNRSSNQGHGNDDDDVMDDPYNRDEMQQEYTPPRQDEQDYYVTFTESVLGLELYSDEDGFNCIVGRCVSTIARQKVTPGSQIVQVNDRWLANYRFEEIRDAVKQAARQPPLAVTFRSPYGNNNGYDQSQSATSPDTHNNNNGMGRDDDDDNDRNNRDRNNKLKAPKSGNNNANSASLDEEKRSQPNDNLNGNGNDDTDFMGTLPFDQCDKLQIGDHIDHRDDVGRFLLATIVDKDQYKVKIHYEGWNSKWDTWCDYKNETHRFAAPRSISRKPNTRFRDLKIRDYVDINPIQRHRGWRVGQIRRMDKYSGQAQIVYKEDGQEFLYWAHLNNPEEIAPFMTRAAETIALQQKIAEFEEEQDQNGNDNIHHSKNKSNHSKSQNNPNIQQPSDSGSPDQININGNNMNTNPLAVNNNNNHIQSNNNNLNPLSPHRGNNNQPQQSFNNSNVQNQQQQQLLNSFMSPPAANTIATDQSMGYNSNVATLNSYAHQSHSSMQFSNGQGQHQPPPANGMNADNSYSNRGNSGPMGGGSNLNLYQQMPNDNGRNMNQRPMNAGHQKSRSRVFPTTIKNKKLPPKPAKNLQKKRNKGINRSRTQPLPDNQNNPNNPAYNGGNNGYNNNQQQYGYNNNGQYQQPQMRQGGSGNNTTSFNDLSFNAPQQFQSQKHTSTTNFMHGKTTYTAQVKPSQSNPNLMNNINVNASNNNNNNNNNINNNNQHNYQQSYGNNRPQSNLNMNIEQQYGSVSSPVNGKKLPPNPFPKKYSGDQHDNI